MAISYNNNNSNMEEHSKTTQENDLKVHLPKSFRAINREQGYRKLLAGLMVVRMRKNRFHCLVLGEATMNYDDDGVLYFTLLCLTLTLPSSTKQKPISSSLISWYSIDSTSAIHPKANALLSHTNRWMVRRWDVKLIIMIVKKTRWERRRIYYYFIVSIG